MARSKEAILRAQKRYEESGAIVRKTLKFHAKNDSDILEYVNGLDNFNGTMKDLIQKEIKARQDS